MKIFKVPPKPYTGGKTDGQHEPYAPGFTKEERAGNTHMDNWDKLDFLRHAEWGAKDPSKHHLTRRPEKRFQEYRPREHGSIRFPNPVAPANKKIVFVGCGGAAIGVVPWVTFNRPFDYNTWVIEPKVQFPPDYTRIYDMFYNHSPEEFISTPHNLNQIIYPKGYGDNYWHRFGLSSIDPEARLITTEDGLVTPYEFLCITAGAHAMWEQIPGSQTPFEHRKGFYSLYDNKFDDNAHFRFKSALMSFKGGKIVFYTPETKFSNAALSASLLNLTHELLTNRGIKFEILQISPTPYSVGDHFLDRKLREEWAKKGNIRVVVGKKLHQIGKFSSKFTDYPSLSSSPQLSEINYDILHVTPPMGAIPAIRNCPSLCDSEGWMDVNYYNFTNEKYPNIFGWGSGTNLPAPKTHFSSLAQSYNGFLTLSYLLYTLHRHDYKPGRYRDQFYEGDGYDVLHWGNRMCSVIETKDRRVNHNPHYPLVYQSFDSQKFGREILTDYMYKVQRIYYTPRDINAMVYRMYPLEPTTEILDQWNSL